MSLRKNMNKPQVSRPANPAANTNRKITRDELAKQIKKMRDRDAEMVTGVFKNLENPAVNGGRGSLVFSYKYYPGDEHVIYELWDGQRYTIPRGVARHLNKNCYYTEYQHLKDEFGLSGVRGAYSEDGRLKSQNMQMARKIHRYAFHSLEYMDDDVDMYPNNFVEVTLSP
jgi:hypothetical protein